MEKGQEETNLVREELPTKQQDSQTQAALHLIIFYFKKSVFGPTPHCCTPSRSQGLQLKIAASC